MKDLISVIVPVYKVEQYLDECVASIVAQTYPNLEIILVDDGSPDRCPEICDVWAQKDKRIKVIHKFNGGLSDARNAGLELASGEYIAFVDSDDWISPDMYVTMHKAMREANADICSCGIVEAYPEYQQSRNLPELVGDSEEILQLLYADTLYPVMAWNKLYHSEHWKNLRFPTGKICEDAFTTYQLVDKAEKIVQINTPLYFYRIRENSIMTSAFSRKRMDEEEAWRCNYEFVAEHYPRLRKAAFDFYLLKVNVVIHAIPKEQRENFAAEYNQLHHILAENLTYLMFESKLPLKQRIKVLLDYFSL